MITKESHITFLAKNNDGKKNLYKLVSDALTVHLYKSDAKEFVIDNQRASATLIERTFDLDWHTADAVISKLYEEGIVGEICDHEPREVLIKKGENK